MLPIYLHEYKITIWWSAKCGCSTLKHLIFNIVQKKNLSDVHQNSYFSFFPECINYKNILIVRNPINRFISAYNNFFYTFVEMYNIKKNITFKEFVKINLESRKNCELLQGKNISLNHHTINQFGEVFDDLDRYCVKNNINFKFDEIIKLEDFNEVEFIKKYFNIVLDKEIILNRTERKNQNIFVFDKIKEEIDLIHPDYQYYLNDEIIKDIKEIYKDDYKWLKKYGIIYDKLS